MPLLGFLGFPLFAVSAYAMYRVLQMAMHRGGIWQRVIWWFLIAIFCLLTFAGIDRHTIVSFIPLIKAMPGVQEQWKDRFQKAGMEKVQDLIRRKVSGLVDLGIPSPEAVELIRKAEMITMKGMGIENYCLLQEAGVKDLSELAHQDPHDLYLTIRGQASLRPTRLRTPFPALVRLWVREAKKRVE
jgi:hypothetical protein